LWQGIIGYKFATYPQICGKVPFFSNLSKKVLQVGNGGLYDEFSGKQRDTSQWLPEKTKTTNIKKSNVTPLERAQPNAWIILNESLTTSVG
jgi:hypothetical protein